LPITDSQRSQIWVAVVVEASASEATDYGHHSQVTASSRGDMDSRQEEGDMVNHTGERHRPGVATE